MVNKTSIGIKVASRHGKRRRIQRKKSNKTINVRTWGKTSAIGEAETLAGLIRRRAENLFETRQLLCSEAVLFALNQGLKGGLPPDATVRLASAFGEGIGRTGCMCGAFAGAMMGLGLFLGREGLNGKGSKRVLGKTRELHSGFKSEFGTTCCSVLTKKVAHDNKALFSQCANQTGEAAEMAARIILEARPELSDQADWDFLETQDSKLEAGINRLSNLIRREKDRSCFS